MTCVRSWVGGRVECVRVEGAQGTHTISCFCGYGMLSDGFACCRPGPPTRPWSRLALFPHRPTFAIFIFTLFTPSWPFCTHINVIDTIASSLVLTTSAVYTCPPTIHTLYLSSQPSLCNRNSAVTLLHVCDRSSGRQINFEEASFFCPEPSGAPSQIRQAGHDSGATPGPPGGMGGGFAL